MKEFQELINRATSSPSYSKILKFTEPLKTQFGINNFWHYKITHSGHYSYLGTHAKWNDYCLDHQVVEPFTSMRHPSTQQSGINLMKNSSHTGFQHVLKTAWEKFGVNFSLNIIKKSSEGVEGFGFATEHHHPKTDEMLLNELPLLCTFVKAFKEEHQFLIKDIEAHPADLESFLGKQFKQNQDPPLFFGNRMQVLKALGYDTMLSFTIREKELLKLVANGYSAPDIAKEIHLSKRTVENYLAVIKCKLSCTSKSELVQKSQDLFYIGYFNET